MRRVFIAAIVLASSAANAAGQVPRLPKNVFYYDARESLSALGWAPATLPSDKRFCTGGREDVCDKYPETATCSGTGLALCSFLWKRGDTLVEVTTYGEEVGMIRVRSVACRAGC